MSAFSSALALRAARLATLEAALPSARLRLAPGTAGQVHADDAGQTLALAPRAAAKPRAQRTAYLCLYDDSFSWGLATASFSSVCAGRAGPVFDGTARTPWPLGEPWISVVAVRVPCGATNAIRVRTTVDNSPYPNSRSVRLRVILDDLTYGPLPDAGPSGSIVLDTEPSQGATLDAVETFTFST